MKKNRLRLALAQLDFCVGDIEGNAFRIIESINKAKARKADIVIFPELALTGYPPQDLLLKKHFVDRNLSALKKVIKATADIIAVVGFVDRSSSGNIFNASAFIQNRKLIDVYHKVNLPNYGVFDEKRYFSSGQSFSSYTFREFKFTVNICEDIWRKDYVQRLVNKNFDFIINISASPFHLGKAHLRKEIAAYTAVQTKSTLLYCNLVGGQDDLIFDGASMVVSGEGECVLLGKRFREDFIVVDLPLSSRQKKNALEVKESEAETVFEALCLGIKDYVRKNGFEKVIVGLSGGIDSAVVVSLATLALGKSNVSALIMPSPYTSKETFDDAKKICRNLGIKSFIVPIDGIFKSYLGTLGPFFKNYPPDKTEENIQARIRGNILMAFSNKFGYLVLNTGNKSELSCGYCTLYGDMVGGFGVLSDVPKTMVYKLANYINKIRGKRLIPLSVIKRPPTAELRPGQKDTDALPPYPLLDTILKMYVEEDLSREEIVRRGMDEKIVRQVIKMVDRNEYKRRQAPIGIKITPRAFGRDRRMPITNRFFP